MKLVPQRSSLIAQTANILREGIRSGIWKDILPGEFELCERLQVSRVTLRGALEQLSREGFCSAGQGRRRRITADIAAPLAEKSDRVVMLSPLPLQNLPASAIFWVDALRDHLAAVGYTLEFVASQSAYSHHPGRALEVLVHQSRSAGWVLYLSTVELQQWFSERGLPCVITGSRHPGVTLSSVDIDYSATCSHAAGLLVARGCQHLALLMPRSGHAGNIESERDFLETTEKLSSLSARIAHHDGSVGGICSTLDRLLRGSNPVDGLLVAKPAHVVTAVSHLLRRGVRLPQDLSLISRDDDPLLEHLVPVVARYHTDPILFARKISRLVLKLVSGGAQRPNDSRMMPELVRGETLG
jgi:DNA-binding LacI/PurR family transcriptional regulator